MTSMCHESVDKGLAGKAGRDILHKNRLAKLVWQNDFLCKVFAEFHSANLCLHVDVAAPHIANATASVRIFVQSAHAVSPHGTFGE